MLLIPAIDLKDGKCVRLRQGEMDQVTRYSDDPAAMAEHWQSLGARYLHVVDLDGAVTGTPQHLSHIEAITKRLAIPVQVGGGIRNTSTIRAYLSCGVDRVVIGTAALQDAHFLAAAATEFPNKILIGIDVKQGLVAVHGWKTVSSLTPRQVFESVKDLPLGGMVFTDISRDGMLAGPNISSLREAVDISPFPVIASGGVTVLKDVQTIQAIGSRISGIIIGKALYEGTLDLKAALEMVALAEASQTSC
ncbi:MAG: 1-(5-phosphoribosyl)-5-[(5-phosphoribosylamino)methylideneamino]imidazole-4-carboxamide isomerase [Nitrospiraceae bacterium]|nr:1-(5-phosphoribosyl)-5-[(5-phosphoribosylamino)methylideneamino]imidazole-4-carboxamide isomerase [Nitrospira sp.]MCA9455814.1 1-(5-phosphoribosyl)-5-[(5-phosphoribosylamino)methylideneamino]imidazole-4-carboxamide isomerase [Nitrospira sp.]MCB9773303.1 1-(5-phosphoribosyl)-5-[(5-phosphoribosylamino)methylideneamino]imidazole-4-carboxamide isomerase [Nitrospiraceae bacterium]